MNTFVLQYISQPESKIPPSIDLHVNFFKNGNDILLKEKIELDIGMRIYSFNAIKTLILFAPISYKSLEDVDDLYDIISNERCLDLIFNSYVNNISKNSSYCNAEFENSNLLLIKIRNSCMVRPVNFNSKEFGKQVIGTEININIEKIMKELAESAEKALSGHECIYIRFRIKGYLQNQVVKALKPPLFSSLLCSGSYPVSQILNFSFNDVRNIDKNYISDYMKQNGASLLQLKSIKFFSAEPCECSIENLSSIPYKVRLLEENLWGDYLEHNKVLYEDMLVYKWAYEIKENERNNCIITFKRNFNKINQWTLLIYLFLAICVGAVSSFLIYLLTSID